MPTLILGDKHGFNFIWKIILTFISVVAFQVNLKKKQFEGNTKGHWDLDKVTTTAL